MTEQEIKRIMRDSKCPECLKELKRKHPNMLDCIFRHNNDEHLCDTAKEITKGEPTK